MKKTLVSIIALLLSVEYIAQLTVGTNTLWQAGDVLDYETINSSNTSYTQNGQNVSYDFTDLTGGISNTESVVLPSTGAAAASFTNADLLFDYIGMEAYATLGNNEVQTLGISGSGLIPAISLPLTFPFSNPLLQQQRPLGFGDQYSDQASFSVKLALANLPLLGAQLDTLSFPGIGDVTVDSIAIIGTVYRDSEVLGEGIASILNYNIPVIKEHSTDSFAFTLEARGTYTVLGFPISTWVNVTSIVPQSVLDISNRTIITDRFLAEDYKESIVEFTQDSQFGNALSAKYTTDFSITTSIHQTSNNIAVFPNPSAGLIWLSGLTPKQEGYNSRVKVKDLSGKTTYSTTIHEDGSVDLSELANGMYLLELNHNLYKISLFK